MEDFKIIAIGLLCSAIFICGLMLCFWNFFRKDTEAYLSDNATLQAITSIPVYIASLGAIAYGVFAYLDPEVSISIGRIIGIVGWMFLIHIVFNLKVMLNYAFIGAALSWSAWKYLNFGVLDMIPTFDIVIAIVSLPIPRWANTMYAVFTFMGILWNIFSAGNSVAESVG